MLEASKNRNSKKTIRRNTYRISEADRRQKETELKKRKRCNKKRRFSTKEEAQAQCDRMRSEVALQITPLEPYYCNRHSIWHIGHDWYSYNTKKTRNGEKELWQYKFIR